MPTYEYQCLSCGMRFDRFQKMSDNATQKCPECGGNVKKLISAGMGMIIKGSGSHSTEHRPDRITGKTCCGRQERCDKPPCSDDGACRR